jgi:glycosyltransferase involved in cell wall biosynthesis
VKSKNIVILSTADWDNPFWTNKQHVAVSLFKLGYRVLYIDSLGLRKPSASTSDVGRIKRRLKKAFKAPKEVQANIWVWSPIILPFQQYLMVRLINKAIFSRWLKFWLWKLDFSGDLLWTYNPLSTRLLNCDGFKNLVYHCVDEIKAQPGMPVDILTVADNELSRKANVIFATSPNLYESRKILNKNTYYFSNVADFNHFNQATLDSIVIPADIAEIPSPIAGFIGAVSGYKLDFELIEFVAKKCPNISFVFIGKVGEGDPWTNIDKISALKNVYFLGPKKYSTLPAYLKAMTITLLPNHINEYTDSMFPMKFFEYLSTGKPVVSVNLKAIQEHREFCYLSIDYEEFAENVIEALRTPNLGLENRLSLARDYTYDSRMLKMIKILEGL